jgi:hypothetical protein
MEVGTGSRADAAWEGHALTKGAPALVREVLTVAGELFEAVAPRVPALEAAPERVSTPDPVALGAAEAEAEPDTLGDCEMEKVVSTVADTVKVAEGVAAALPVPPLRLGAADAEPDALAAPVAERLSVSEKDAVAEPLRVAPVVSVCELDADTMNVAVTWEDAVAVEVAEEQPEEVAESDTRMEGVWDADTHAELELE